MAISLSDDFQFKMFDHAMKTLEANRDDLNSRERQFFEDLRTSYDTVGRVMTITVKQLNWLKQIAFDLEKDS